uniref:Uncharacterized protein n=1 Tax=Anopheles farauti TaxID=69004 RepID=A0A182Q6F2_9DIPT
MCCERDEKSSNGSCKSLCPTPTIVCPQDEDAEKPLAKLGAIRVQINRHESARRLETSPGK